MTSAARAVREPPTWATVVGIDPGAHTGIVILKAPLGRVAPDLSRAKILAHTRISRTVRKTESDIAADQRFANAVTDYIDEQTGTMARVFIECPSDARPYWGRQDSALGGKATSKKGMAVGTLFLLGKHYGLIVAGLTMLSTPATSYRVKEWMGARSHIKVAGEMALFARAAGLPLSENLSDDELMALGVAVHGCRAWTNSWSVLSA